MDNKEKLVILNKKRLEVMPSKDVLKVDLYTLDDINLLLSELLKERIDFSISFEYDLITTVIIITNRENNRSLIRTLFENRGITLKNVD